MTRTNGTYDGFGRLHRRLVCGAALSGALALTVSLAPALASEPATGEPTVPAVATQPAAAGLPTTQGQSEADQATGGGASGAGQGTGVEATDTTAEPAPDSVPPAPEVAPTEPTEAAEPETPVESAPPTEPAAPAEPVVDAAEKPAWLQGENLHISASPVWVGDSVFAGQTVTVSVTLDADDPAELPALADVSLPGSAGLEPTGPITQDGATFSREFLVTGGAPVGSYLEISVLINETATHAESTALDINTMRRAQMADYADYLAVRNSIDDDRLLLDYQSPNADELLEFVTGLDGDAVFLHLPVEEQGIVDLYTWTLRHYIDELVPKTHVTLTVMTPSTDGVGPGGVLEVYVDVKGLNDVEELPPAEGNIVILAAIGEENPLPYADDSGGPVRVTYPESGMAGYLAKFRVPDDAPLGSTIEIEAVMLGDSHASDGIATATAAVALADASALQEAVAQAAELLYGQGGTDFTAESLEALEHTYIAELNLLSGLSRGLFVMPDTPEDIDAINAGLAKVGAAFQSVIDTITDDLNNGMRDLVFDGSIIIAPQTKVYDGTTTFASVTLMGVPGTTFGDAGRISGIAQISAASVGTYTEVVIPRSELAISGDNTDPLWAAVDAITDEDGLIHASSVSFTVEKAEPRLTVSMPAQVTAGEAFQVCVTMDAPEADPDGIGLPAPEQISIAVDGATGDGVITKEGCTYVATFTAGDDTTGATLTATARVLDGATNYAAGGNASATATVEAAPEQPGEPDDGDKEPQPGTTTPSDDKKDEPKKDAPKKQHIPKTGDETVSPAAMAGIAAGGAALVGAGAALIARRLRRKGDES